MIEAMVTPPAGESMADRAYRVLRDRLIMLDIAPGEPMNEVLLGEALKVGRTPVREALKRLEADHLVISYPRRGTFATGVDITELVAISDMRRVLEPLAARLAATHRGGPLKAELETTMTRIRALTSDQSPQELLRYDLEVHRLIYRATHNNHLEETLVRLDNLATRMWCVMITKIHGVKAHIEEHVLLIESILAGEAEQAETLARQHVDHFDAAIRAAL